MVTYSNHIALDVSCREDAVAFYCDVLGMSVLEESSIETVLQCGDTVFHIQEAERPEVYLEFEVENIGATAEDLRERNCELKETETPESEQSLLVKDPFGISYHIFESYD